MDFSITIYYFWTIHPILNFWGIASLEILKNRLDAVLCHVLQADPPWVGRSDQMTHCGPFKPYPCCDSVVVFVFVETGDVNWYCQRSHWELGTQTPRTLNKFVQEGCLLVHRRILPCSTIKKGINNHQFTFYKWTHSQEQCRQHEGYKILQHSCTMAAFYCMFNNLKSIKYLDRNWIAL